MRKRFNMRWTNRLWVRLSLAISGVFLAIVIVPSLLLLILGAVFDDNHRRDEFRPQDHGSVLVEEGQEPNRRNNDGRFDEFRGNSRDAIMAIPRMVLQGFLVIGLVGIGAGVLVSRTVTRPVTKLAQATRTIGQGNFSHRVQVKGSQELQELAGSLNQMAADLEQAETVRRNLMADVSHELRTPLTVLEGNLRAALDHVYELDDEELANLYGQTRHLINLVNDLRELTLAEAHRLPLNLEPINVGELVDETLAVFEPLTEEKEIALVNIQPETAVTTQADQSRLRQVLHNLLSNALRHTPNGGEIKVSVEQLTQAVRIRVADNGEGIEPDLVAHVFDRFYRTDRSRSRDTGGTGLGLAIVRAIIEAHGGTVTAASDGTGKGAQFAILLPPVEKK